MIDRPIFTCQTRLTLTPAQSELLDRYAALHGEVQRALFAALKAGRNANEIKSTFQNQYSILARHYNSARIELDGKTRSIKERRTGLLTESRTRIKKAEQGIKKLTAIAPHSNKLHQKKRRLASLLARYQRMKHDDDAGRVRLCFGSKKRFHAQFNLEANGYANHAAWRADWQRARSEQFLVVGSKDETAGNQLCQTRLRDDGTFTLALRLPDAIAPDLAKPHLELSGVQFAYGYEDIVHALSSGEKISMISASGRATKKRIGTPLSYRFLRDEKGWRVFVSLLAAPVDKTCTSLRGAIGVDINADHLAVAETDHFGNLTRAHRLEAVTYGKSPHQTRAILGDAANKIARLAQTSGQPVAVEKLDFAKKKSTLESVSKDRSRALSSFAYGRALASIKSACYRHGVELIEINPAYTSVIGAVNFAQRLGRSTHQGAALAIARRSLGLSERPTVRTRLVPARNGGHVTFALPVRNRAKHVWSFWSKIQTSLKAAHVAHYRCGAHKAAPPPLTPAMRSSSAIWSSSAKSRSANRPPHCSVDVLDEIPE